MKKLLLIALLTASSAQAGQTNDVRFPFIANGGFKGLCDSLGWNWGYWLSGGVGGFGTYACLSTKYIKVNRIDDFIKE
jgi:hypothetical protein